MKPGKLNISAGLLFMAGFMAYGFVLIYLRDFAPGKVEWIAGSSDGVHFEAKLAHVHGNLFALLNILFGYMLMKLDLPLKNAKIISKLLLVGMLMPLGIMAEFLLGVPPYLVVVGAVSMVIATAYFGISVLKSKK